MKKKANKVYNAFTITNNKGKNYWHNVGAVFENTGGDTLTLQLHSLPIDGRIVLCPPKAKEEHTPETESEE